MELDYTVDQDTADALVDRIKVQAATLLANQPGPQGVATLSLALDQIAADLVTALGVAA